jgi:hypothetical protein
MDIYLNVNKGLESEPNDGSYVSSFLRGSYTWITDFSRRVHSIHLWIKTKLNPLTWITYGTGLV